jgi:methyl-accepting chemotaxis protein
MQLPQVFFVIFAIAVAVGVLLQAGVLLGMFFAIKKSAQQAKEVSDKINQHLVPALATARNLLEDVSPKIKVATANLVETSHTVREQAHRVERTVNEVTTIANVQAQRVDEMATAVLDGVTQATAAVQHGIATPLRHVAGVLNGLRAGFDVLRKKETPLHVEEDGGNFV